MTTQRNPFFDAYPTSLGRLSEHDWNILDSHWAKGIDYCVFKVGRRWRLMDVLGAFPLFDTKREAYEAGTRLILAESRHRAMLRWEKEHRSA